MLRELVLTTVILAPGASEGGLRAAAQTPIPGNPGMKSGRLDFVHRHGTWSPFALKVVSNFEVFDPPEANVDT